MKHYIIVRRIIILSIFVINIEIINEYESFLTTRLFNYFVHLHVTISTLTWYYETSNHFNIMYPQFYYSLVNSAMGKRMT